MKRKEEETACIKKWIAPNFRKIYFF